MRVISFGKLRDKREDALVHRLAHTAQLEATDARDKVFGTLATCSLNVAINPKPLKTDYCKSVEQVGRASR
jgi:hypothetical protein